MGPPTPRIELIVRGVRIFRTWKPLVSSFPRVPYVTRTLPLMLSRTLRNSSSSKRSSPNPRVEWFDRRDVWKIADSFAAFMAGLRPLDEAGASAAR